MATRDKDGQITETDEEASQAERSPDTFYILVASLLALVAIGIGLFWYFGVFG
jgi:hypothetical protein